MQTFRNPYALILSAREQGWRVHFVNAPYAGHGKLEATSKVKRRRVQVAQCHLNGSQVEEIASKFKLPLWEKGSLSLPL
jgi:hypothetical protein